MRDRDRFRSVQIRTTATAMLTLLLILAAGAVALVAFVEREQLGEVDRRLHAATDVVQRFSAAPSASGLLSEVPDDASLVQVVDRSSKVVFASDRLKGLPPLRQTQLGATGVVSTVDVPEVGALRVIAIPLNQLSVLLAEPLTGVEDAVSSLTTALVIGVPILAVVLGIVVWLVAGRTLRPVREVLEREQRLVADVSHELRTPIAGVRALLESESVVPAEIELNRRGALAVLGRLEALTNDLLTVERADNASSVSGELIDLDEVALDVGKQVPRPSGVEIDLAGISPAQVRGDDSDLRRLVTNLLANACRHAHARVMIDLHEFDDGVVLSVGDDGPGIPESDRQRVFDRFTRLDDARARDDGAGAGLGLPIAQAIVLAHGGHIDVSTSALGGALFRVVLPGSG